MQSLSVVKTSAKTISVIMPTYNRADLLMASIESVRQQSFTDWELLVVDDGSNDNTEDIVKSIVDQRISYHKIPHCGKLGQVRNHGLQLATADYIAFADSDDLWHPEKLAQQMNALQRHPESFFCLTNGYNFKTEKQPLHFFYKQKDGEKFDDLFISCFSSGVACFCQSLLFRRSCLEKTGFLEEERLSDRNFIVSLCFFFKGVILFEPLFFRRLHESNLNSSEWMINYEYEIELIQRYRHTLPFEVYRNALFHLYLNFGEEHLVNDNKKEAARMFAKAAGINPFALAPIKKLGKTLMHQSRSSSIN